jgi:hypothetical protein
LDVGDRIFIASERLGPARFDETDLGNVLAWRRTDQRWVFLEEALRDGSNDDFYPPAARAARTTAAILRLVSNAALPETSTAPNDRPSAPGPLPMFIGIFLLTLGVTLRRGGAPTVDRPVMA